jgi:hypothetical protein
MENNMADPALKAFRTWLTKAKPGDDYVYHTGYLGDKTRSTATFQAAAEAEEAGDIALFQKPWSYFSAQPGSEYHARRLSPRAAVFLDRLSRAA